MSTSPDETPPSAPKSPLSGAPIPPAPAPAPAPAASSSGLTKSAFKVTRSPFAPRISGTPGASGASPLGAAGGSSAAPGRVPARKVVTATGDFTKQESAGLVALDFIAAAVAIAAAVMMALDYFKQ